jgi:hypothetical protein
MLKNAKAVATVATSDSGAAQAFYGGTLGLPMMSSAEQFAAYLLPDGSALFVYERPNHVAPASTCVTFIVGDIEAEVADLRTEGIQFEEYDMPGLKTENGIASMGPEGQGKAAWFKDPAGNILSLSTLPL